MWNEAGANPHLIEFASNIRQWFLVRIAENRFPADTISGGVTNQEDVTMKPAQPQPAKDSSKSSATTSADGKDPWLKNDPWLKSLPRPAQCKWEDLILKDPVPFTGSDGALLSQNHRLQIGGARGGIVLATKAHIQDIVKAAGSIDLAVLLPASDTLPQFVLQGKLTGPFEVSVEDNSAKIAYKRLVRMYVIRGSINFKLPNPVAKLPNSRLVLSVRLYWRLTEGSSPNPTLTSTRRTRSPPLKSCLEKLSPSLTALPSFLATELPLILEAASKIHYCSAF